MIASHTEAVYHNQIFNLLQLHNGNKSLKSSCCLKYEYASNY